MSSVERKKWSEFYRIDESDTGGYNDMKQLSRLEGVCVYINN